MIIVFVLIILEGAITVDVFLNNNWEEVRSFSAVNYEGSSSSKSLYLLFDDFQSFRISPLIHQASLMNSRYL
jgi:hypothetical protein